MPKVAIATGFLGKQARYVEFHGRTMDEERC
jgi:hypothetical protein